MRKTEVISRNEFDKSYLLIQKTILEENYIFKMLMQNRIPGIPECRTRYLEETEYLAYDITDKRTLERTYADKKMNFGDLTELFYGIRQIMHCANDYLLDREGFLLQPGYMFMDLETEELSCLYYPQDEDLRPEEKYRPLADFLLDRIDHKDEHAVTIAYHFYKISKEEYFSFESFIGFMEKEILLANAGHQKKEQPQKEEAVIKDEDFWSMDDAGLPHGTKSGDTGTERERKKGLFSVLKNIAEWYREKKDPSYEEPERPVRIEEYFDDVPDDVTVFFDKDEYLTFQWKEGHFSKEHILEEFPVTVGKMKGKGQMIIEDSSVSRLHARLRKQGETVYLQDLDSTNGTYVNKKQLFAGEERIIKRGDEIQFGKIIVNVV